MKTFPGLLLPTLVILGAPYVAFAQSKPAPPTAADKYVTRSTGGAPIYNLASPDRIPGKYIVGFKQDGEMIAAGASIRQAEVMPGVLPNSRENVEVLATAMAERVSGAVGSMLEAPGIRAFALSEVSERDITDVLARDPRVEYIEAELNFQPLANQTLPFDDSAWHLDRVDQRSLPLDHNYRYGVDGANVYVHLIDTGLRLTHVEFEGRAGSDQYWCPYLDMAGHETDLGDDDECVRITKQRFCKTWSVLAGPETVCDLNPGYYEGHMDCGGHGTSMASLIGGKNYGVAKKVHFISYNTNWSNPDHPCTTAPAQTTTSTSYSAALNEVRVQLRAGYANVVNLSWAAVGQSPSIEGLISNLLAAGATVVTGGGNDNQDACTMTPARMSATSSVITAGASNRTDGRWWDSTFHGSAYGQCITLFAPGSDMVYAVSDTDTSYAYRGPGTSIATAITSGVAALYLSTHPLSTPAEVKAGLINISTRGQLNTSHPLNGIGPGSPNLLIYSQVPRGDLPSLPIIQTLLGLE